jgi:hypothetical protein
MSNETWAAIVGAIVGGLLTAISSAIVLGVQIRNDSKRRAEEQRERVNTLLRALYHEIDSVWRMYMSGSGAALVALPPDRPFMVVTPTAGEYFPIYLGNVTSLGSIPDSGLRDKIINTYTLARALIDGLMRNNALLSDFALSPYRQNLEPTIFGATRDSGQLKQFGPLLKKCHMECEAAVEALLPELLDATRR